MISNLLQELFNVSIFFSLLHHSRRKRAICKFEVTRRHVEQRWISFSYIVNNKRQRQFSQPRLNFAIQYIKRGEWNIQSYRWTPAMKHVRAIQATRTFDVVNAVCSCISYFFFFLCFFCFFPPCATPPSTFHRLLFSISYVIALSNK